MKQMSTIHRLLHTPPVHAEEMETCIYPEADPRSQVSQQDR